MGGAEGKRIGSWGEQVAADFLHRRGYRVLDRNFACRFGELDLVAEDRRYLVFVEVKTRKNGDFAQAREAVTPAKQRRILAAAQLWLQLHPRSKQPRFDVVEVYGEAGRVDRIEHIKNAFEA